MVSRFAAHEVRSALAWKADSVRRPQQRFGRARRRLRVRRKPPPAKRCHHQNDEAEVHLRPLLFPPRNSIDADRFVVAAGVGLVRVRATGRGRRSRWPGWPTRSGGSILLARSTSAARGHDNCANREQGRGTSEEQRMVEPNSNDAHGPIVRLGPRPAASRRPRAVFDIYGQQAGASWRGLAYSALFAGADRAALRGRPLRLPVLSAPDRQRLIDGFTGPARPVAPIRQGWVEQRAAHAALLDRGSGGLAWGASPFLTVPDQAIGSVFARTPARGPFDRLLRGVVSSAPCGWASLGIGLSAIQSVATGRGQLGSAGLFRNVSVSPSRWSGVSS